MKKFSHKTVPIEASSGENVAWINKIDEELALKVKKLAKKKK